VRLAGVAKGLTRADLKSVAGSVGTGSALAGGFGMARQVEPTATSQDQTIMHQMMQRAAVNDMQLPQEVAPYTQFQTAGLPNRNQFLNDYIYPPVAGTEVELPDVVKRALQRTGLELG